MPEPSSSEGAARRVEQAVREAYGRLVAILAASWRDVAAVEDALSDAFVAALQTWPSAGVPQKPEAWLLAAARRRLIDGARHAKVQAAAAETILVSTEKLLASAQAMSGMFPDDRLSLLFVCAHPAIAPEARTPLMLQVVLGLDAARIASAFLVSPTAMGQRLVRAKAKIRDAGIRFAVPDPAELANRLEAVLECIYAAYGSGWHDASGSHDPQFSGLAEEAIWLGRVVVDLLPDEPEARGLLALMLYCEARRTARRDQLGGYVPLYRQNHASWSAALIGEAERQLAQAARAARHGRFQIEAAIQSAHVIGIRLGRPDWEAIMTLYNELLRHAPTIGARVGRAASIAEARGPKAALAALDELPVSVVDSYQPYWALRACLLKALDRSPEACAARDRAISLSEDPAVREFLKKAPS